MITIFALLAWYGFYLEKQGQNLSINPQNNNMTQLTLQEGEIIWKEGQVHVLIDISENAYTVYMSPDIKTTEQEAVKLLEKFKANGSKVTIIPLDQFIAGKTQTI